MSEWACRFFPNRRKQRFKILRRLYKRIAMIREWKRDQSRSCQPTLHLAKHDSIRQQVSWSACGECPRLVFVCSAQGVQPLPSMEDGGTGMRFHQRAPYMIVYRVGIYLYHFNVIC